MNVAAASAVTPTASNSSMRASRGWARVLVTHCSPVPGVCQSWAKSCHTYSGSSSPATSLTHERIRSGRVDARRSTNPPPQSWPTRSTGSPIDTELGGEPLDVLLLRRREPVRRGDAEAGELQRDDVVPIELGQQWIPHRWCLRIAMNEHRRHLRTVPGQACLMPAQNVARHAPTACGWSAIRRWVVPSMVWRTA